MSSECCDSDNNCKPKLIERKTRPPLLEVGFLTALFTSIVMVAVEIASVLEVELPRNYALMVFAIALPIVGRNVLKKGVIALLRLDFASINLLMIIAGVGAFFLQEYEEAAVVITLFNLAEKLEEIGFKTSKNALEKLTAANPQMAFLKEWKKEVPVDQVRVGDIVLVKPSQTIPLDGKVTLGFSAVDEAMITGEPLPADKVVGDLVFAGTLNGNGYLEVTVTKLASQSTLNRIVSATEKALSNKGNTQKFIETFSKYYTPAILVFAIALAVVPIFVFGLEAHYWLQSALSLLVISCPCALVISTPISIYSALAAASKEGALIKGGSVVEALGKIKVVALDKTRTLTFGRPKVTQIIPIGNTDEDYVLACAAGMEVFSEHPIAQSIFEHAKSKGVSVHKVSDFESHPGKGASAKCLVCHDEKHYLGRLNFVLGANEPDLQIEKVVSEITQKGETAIVLGNSKGIEGVLSVSDELRPETKKVISRLKQMSVKSVILTGDQSGPAKMVADAIGIDEFHAALLPEQKAEKIRELKSQNRIVAMAGDGVNDAPALATADVGIAMGAAGSDVAIDAASVALMNDRLELLPFLIQLGRKTLLIIKGNTAFALFTKATVVVLAIFGKANLPLAIFADVGVTLIVILTSLSILKVKNLEQRSQQ